MFNSSSTPAWQEGEACLEQVDELSLDQHSETCDWKYNGEWQDNPVPTCYPQGEGGEAGRCVTRSLCDEKRQSEDTTAYSGFCPGPNDVQCCVGLDAAGN